MIKYFKTLWENNITPVNGRNLNKIEDALEYLYDVIRNVPSEENVRIANEKQRQSNETTRSNSEIKRNATFDSKIKDVDKAINASNENIVEVNNKFESITASKQQDAEVIIARDGEISLNARIERDVKKGKLIEETKTGEYLTFDDTVDSIIPIIELHGNTIQNPNTLEIKSTGVDNGDGTWTYEVVACGENLFNGKVEIGSIDTTTGLNASRTDFVRCVDFIKVNSNTQMVGKLDGYSVRVSCVYFYDITKKFISSTNLPSVATPFTTPSNCSYIRFVCYEDKASLDNYKKIKLQEGTVATPYTPYIETKCKIKLPCQLSGVKGLSDILYYDTTENAWCINKQIAYLNYSELTDIGVASSLENCIQIHGTSKKEIKQYDSSGRTLITSKPFKHSFDDDEHMWIDSNSWRYKASIPKTIARTLDEVKIYLAKGDLFMYFWDKNPEKIVLPQSEQIKLNSFANKTHIYTISGEVDATIKATVSKSLASTVQANTNEINILNSKIADIQGLKESQDFAYETDKGYLVCKDTQNGVVKDLKIYGKSLVNLNHSKITAYCDIAIEPKKITHNTTTISYVANTVVGKEYTIVKYPSNRFVIGFAPSSEYMTNLTSFIQPTLDTTKTEVVKVVATDVKMIVYVTNESKETPVVVLEGDHTQNPPQYFEGIASVGNGNEIEVLSNNGGDLLKNSEVVKGGYYKRTDGTVFQESNSFRIENYIEVVGGMKFYSPQVCIYIAYDRNKNFISGAEISSKEDYTYEVPQNAKYIRFSFYNRLDIINQLWVSTLNKLPNVQYKQDKKPILFKDADGNWKPVTELRGIDLNNCDTIEQHSDGNYYLHIRTEKGVLNGNETNWSVSDSPVNPPSNTTLSFQRAFGGILYDASPTIKIITDKFQSVINSSSIPMSTDMEWIRSHSSTSENVGIKIKKSKLETQDVAGFKKWLQNNPVNYICVLAQEKVYQVSPLDLEAFEDETMWMIESGPVSPHSEFKVTSSIQNFAKNTAERVDRLEDEVYKMNLANFAVSLNALELKSRLEALEAPQK